MRIFPLVGWLSRSRYLWYVVCLEGAMVHRDLLQRPWGDMLLQAPVRSIEQAIVESTNECASSPEGNASPEPLLTAASHHHGVSMPSSCPIRSLGPRPNGPAFSCRAQSLFKPSLLATKAGGCVVATNHVSTVDCAQWVADLTR